MRKLNNPYLGDRKGYLFSKKSEPKTLYKTSSLRWDKATDTVSLSSVSPIMRPTAMNDDAQCIVPHEDGEGLGFHLSYPSRFCTCGFHGYSDYADAVTHSQSGDVILKVVASGKMFEYDKGYRFGHQRVEGVVISEHCRAIGCQEKTEALFVDIDGMECFLRPVCAKHASTGESMSLERFAEIVSRTLPKTAPRITVSLPHHAKVLTG